MRTQPAEQKRTGSYYTPQVVVDALLRWAVRESSDRLLDPSCGDGRFLAGHANSVGVEQDRSAAALAIARAPAALVHEGDFFSWASNTHERFECAAGNPPFIRYQTFKGETRERALKLCAKVGAKFSGLSSSWAPFLVAVATLLKPGGRMSFVVPAEIGHAPYARPLLEFLVSRFALVHVVAIKKKLFDTLSEDCWLLHAEGYGSATDEIRFSAVDSFRGANHPPTRFVRVDVQDWRGVWGGRLRPYLLEQSMRELYAGLASEPKTMRLSELATVGIGYVSGDNDFFHLRPSDASKFDIPKQFLHPSVRNGRALPTKRLTPTALASWESRDEQFLLLRINKGASKLPASVSRYLDSEQGHVARTSYKCSVRDPWYSVPDVQVPDFFLSYMSSRSASLVANEAGATCTNSVHSVRLKDKSAATHLARVWDNELVQLSCELEGHPLGGGMLKLEPREAGRLVIPTSQQLRNVDKDMVANAVDRMRTWRHYAPAR